MQPIGQNFVGGHYSRQSNFSNVGRPQKKNKKIKSQLNQSSQLGRQILTQQDKRLETIKNRLQGKLSNHPPLLPEVALLNALTLMAPAMIR